MGVFVLPSAKNAGWHDLSITKAGTPNAYANNAWEVWIVSSKLNSPLSNNTFIIKSLKFIKTNAAGIEKNKPIFNEINNSLENWFASFVALDFDSEVNRVVPKAIPIIPKGNWAILSAK